MDVWNCIKLDSENGRYNMMIYEGLVGCLCWDDSCVIVIPNNMELK